MSLPILEHEDKIISALISNQVIIVTGEPGCGKSTKLPQFCVDSSSLRKKLNCRSIRLAITQPRRVAAIAMAKRVAYERNCKLGTKVGYCIRFEDVSSSKTVIKYLTDGVLIRECLSLSFSKNYDIVILDEAHERSLDTDILIALLKKQSETKKNFRLIITSATIDIQLFSIYFNNAPVIAITGRQYEIEILHSSSKSDRRVEYVVNAAIRIHLHEGPGDVLAFLTGSDECEKSKTLCFEILQKLESKGKPVASMLILALYGAMSSEEQAKVFKSTPKDCRKVVFSTNISETSITVDGIGFVIDCGYVKQKQFNPSNCLDALMIVPISKQQAKQRAGRAGRTQSGKCFRLYSESFYSEQMQETLKAEIHRSNLSSVVLILKMIGIPVIKDFEFIEPPTEESLIQACKHLYLIGALTETGKITKLGREISKFPIDPAYARCLIASIAFKCTEEMLTLVALLSVESIWQNIPKSNQDKFEEAKKVQSQFYDKTGDHITILKVYELWKDSERSQDWCYNNYINYRSMIQAYDIRHQLKEIMRTVYIHSLPEDDLYLEYKNSLNSVYTRIRFSLCIGFYINAGRAVVIGQEGSYLSVKDGTMLHVDKNTSVAQLQSYPTWIIYTQLSGNTLQHGTIKLLSKVKSKWLESLVPKLENVDTNKLMGTETPVKRQREETTAEPEPKQEITQIIELAKQRYLKRKTSS